MKDKEKIYDTEIEPHMKAILEICKRENIAMLASFDVPNDADPDLCCTSMTPNEEGNPKRHLRALAVIKGESGVSPMRITTRGAQGNTIREMIVLDDGTDGAAR